MTKASDHPLLKRQSPREASASWRSAVTGLVGGEGQETGPHPRAAGARAANAMVGSFVVFVHTAL